MLREGDAGDATERVLVDPERFAAGGVPHAINWYQSSWDGRTLAVGISAAGSEDASMHLIDVASGRALLEMSTYHQIKDGTAYPAVMFTHGVNDPRVEVWNTTKTAARVMAATTSGKPVLVRLDYEAGHGIGNTKSQALDERADLFAFLLWQMGLPGWAPQG